MASFNVSIGFQYQINAEDSREAGAEARRRLMEDIEDAFSRTAGIEDLVLWADVRVSPGVDYDALIDNIENNVSF